MKQLLPLLLLPGLLCFGCSPAAEEPGSPPQDPKPGATEQDSTEPSAAADFFAEADQPAVEQLREVLSETTGADSDSLAVQFFQYGRLHPHELTMLPAFEPNSSPGWDDLPPSLSRVGR